MSSATKAPKIKYPGVVLHIRIEPPTTNEGYCHVKGWFSRRADVLDYGNLYYHGGDPGAHLAHVKLTSQSDYTRLADPSSTFPFYALAVEWDEDHNDLAALKRGVATLSKIIPAMERSAERYGEPQSIGQWVLRVANACGIGHVEVASVNDYGSRREMTPRDAQWSIDQRVFEWRAIARKMRGIPDVA